MAGRCADIRLAQLRGVSLRCSQARLLRSFCATPRHGRRLHIRSHAPSQTAEGGSSDEWENFLIRRVDSVPLPLNGTVPAVWSENEGLSLFHYLAGNRTLLMRTVAVEADPSVGPLHFGVYPVDVDHASLLDHVVASETDETGHGAVTVAAVEGAWAISVWRDPRDAPGGALPLVPTSFSIRILPQRPDLEPADLAGWAAPLVPRPADGQACRGRTDDPVNHPLPLRDSFLERRWVVTGQDPHILNPVRPNCQNQPGVCRRFVKMALPLFCGGTCTARSML